MRVAKLDDKLAVTLPPEVVEALSLKEGDEVDLHLTDHNVLELKRRMTREEALENLKNFRMVLPADWKFDREEANSR